jgi:GNAT superfamily N-acetyltransferase
MVVAGDPAGFTPQELLTLGFRGLIEAPAAFEPLLKAAYADLRTWPRVIGTLAGGDAPAPPPGFAVRRLCVGDASLARAIDPAARWIWSHAASVEERLSRGDVWGVLAMEGRLASVALPFTIGDRYEDIGVFTEPRDRRAGLSTACAAALVHDVATRGRIASWSTTPDNLPSLRVAEKLAFRPDREDVLYVVGVEVPAVE